MKPQKYFFLLLCMALFTSCSFQTQHSTNLSPAPTIGASETPLLTSPLPDISFRFAAVGDNLIHSPIYKEAYRRTNGTGYDFSPVYANIAEAIQEHDIAMINQETPLGGTPLGLSSYPLFNSPQEVGDAVVEAGFHLINHANNHILDAGEAGLKNTLTYWKSLNIPVIGAMTKEDKPILYLSHEGITVALLSYTYGMNGMRLSEKSPYRISLLNKATVESEATEARKNADLVIASVHWGDENILKYNEEQRAYAKLFAAHNVDLVVGHHPHVLQPLESLPRADGREMWVAYSLGNFVSNQNDAENMLGGLLSVEFRGNKGNMLVQNIRMIPTITHFEAGYKNTKIYFLEDYTKTLAAKHGCLKYDSNFSLAYMQQLYQNAIPAAQRSD